MNTKLIYSRVNSFTVNKHPKQATTRLRKENGEKKAKHSISTSFEFLRERERLLGIITINI